MRKVKIEKSEGRCSMFGGVKMLGALGHYVLRSVLIVAGGHYGMCRTQ
jgi:hypothetical protein